MSELERWLSPNDDRLALEVSDGVSLSRSGMRLREYSDDEEALLDASVGERCVSSGVRGDGDELLEDDDAENAIVGAASRDDGNSILSEGKTGLSSSGPS